MATEQIKKVILDALRDISDSSAQDENEWARDLGDRITRLVKSPKSEPQIDMETSLAEAFYQMCVPSLCPEHSENLDGIMAALHKARGLGEFKLYPRD